VKKIQITLTTYSLLAAIVASKLVLDFKHYWN
jgi:hypothetical protein